MNETYEKVRKNYTLSTLVYMSLYARYLSYRNPQSVHQVKIALQDGNVAVFAEYLNGHRIP